MMNGTTVTYLTTLITRCKITVFVVTAGVHQHAIMVHATMFECADVKNGHHKSKGWSSLDCGCL